ncbi:YdeI/OmpD-associated family protein [Parasphingorhabdus sp.]|uniref:YdeI/OmpD-associated family protein n=1 Tax=Parasphingorhabdus sp. TaxID=2709688 RepID=UPI002F932B26
MTQKRSTPEIDKLLNKPIWQEERKKLRSLILDCGLDESVKWSKLCYSYQGSNAAIIYAMKNYCALGFFKGALLEDDKNILVKPGKHSQAMRQMRFSGLQEITDNENTIKAYIAKAIQAEKDGLEVDFDAKENLTYPDELVDILDGDPELAEAFDTLTPGRKRGYILHFTDAKQSKTRVARIEKSREKILKGKGYNER